MVWPLVAVALGVLTVYLLAQHSPKCPNCKSSVVRNSPQCKKCGMPLGWRN